MRNNLSTVKWTKNLVLIFDIHGLKKVLKGLKKIWHEVSCRNPDSIIVEYFFKIIK